MTRSIYLAGASSEAAMVRHYAASLEAAGWVVVHDWWTDFLERGCVPGRDCDLSPEKRRACAREDLAAVRRASVVWLLVPEGDSIGAWVEFGAALTLGASGHVLVSGCCDRTIFTEAADRCFASHADALAWLRARTEEEESHGKGGSDPLNPAGNSVAGPVRREGDGDVVGGLRGAASSGSRGHGGSGGPEPGDAARRDGAGALGSGGDARAVAPAAGGQPERVVRLRSWKVGDLVRSVLTKRRGRVVAVPAIVRNGLPFDGLISVTFDDEPDSISHAAMDRWEGIPSVNAHCAGLACPRPKAGSCRCPCPGCGVERVQEEDCGGEAAEKDLVRLVEQAWSTYRVVKYLHKGDKAPDGWMMALARMNRERFDELFPPVDAVGELSNLFKEANLVPYVHATGCAVWSGGTCDKGCGPPKPERRVVGYYIRERVAEAPHKEPRYWSHFHSGGWMNTRSLGRLYPASRNGRRLAVHTIRYMRERHGLSNVVLVALLEWKSR